MCDCSAAKRQREEGTSYVELGRVDRQILNQMHGGAHSTSCFCCLPGIVKTGGFYFTRRERLQATGHVCLSGGQMDYYTGLPSIKWCVCEIIDR